jgi:hypothetical protein
MGERVRKFFLSTPYPSEDIFSYISRVEKYEEEIEKLLILLRKRKKWQEFRGFSKCGKFWKR